MSNGAIHQLPVIRSSACSARSPSESDPELGMLLGLYHGYDQARVALARLACQYGEAQAADDEATRRQIWSRVQRQGIAADLFHPPLLGATTGINRGAHAATLAAFATVSEQAEKVLRRIHARWPELCEDAGGPLPRPASPDPA